MSNSTAFHRPRIQIIAENKIRAAIEAGEFDNLPGFGKPPRSLTSRTIRIGGSAEAAARRFRGTPISESMIDDYSRRRFESFDTPNWPGLAIESSAHLESGWQLIARLTSRRFTFTDTSVAAAVIFASSRRLAARLLACPRRNFIVTCTVPARSALQGCSDLELVPIQLLTRVHRFAAAPRNIEQHAEHSW